MKYTLRQGSVMSQQCPTGGREAEELYQLGRQYSEGHGVPVDTEKAEKLFEESLAKGSAKAAIAIGKIYMYDYQNDYPEAMRNKYMLAMYMKGIQMGCPEAYLALAECYEKGWGVRANKNKGLALLKRSAEMGSPKAMEFWGEYLYESMGQMEEGRKWLRRSIDLGNGDAGVALAWSYRLVDDINGIINSFRAGARLGSAECLLELEALYADGRWGQNKDIPHSECYRKIRDAIDLYYPPKPIPDFDKRCPLKQPFQPLKN